jgi:hypothetical protein
MSDETKENEKVESKESSSHRIEDSNILDVIKTKPRSKSLPMFQNNANPRLIHKMVNGPKS